MGHYPSGIFGQRVEIYDPLHYLYCGWRPAFIQCYIGVVHFKSALYDPLQLPFHTADCLCWKKHDKNHPSFGQEAHNRRLGIATDGFDHFSDKSHMYSIWLVVFIPYNVSPEMCLKDTNYLLTLLITGPKAPTNDINFYIKPLVDELCDMWENGVDVYDTSKKKNFKKCACVIWTINNLLAYANLSRWDTYGNLACTVCKMDTHYCRLKNERKCTFFGY